MFLAHSDDNHVPTMVLDAVGVLAASR